MAHGKRAGERPKRRFRPALLLIALGITLAVVAWGYLVYAAIEFGGEARDGESEAWWWLAVAAVGAAACLFVGLMLIARFTRALGITEPPAPKEPKEPKSPFERPDPPQSPPAQGSSGSSGPAPGGHRAAR